MRKIKLLSEPFGTLQSFSSANGSDGSSEIVLHFSSLHIWHFQIEAYRGGNKTTCPFGTTSSCLQQNWEYRGTYNYKIIITFSLQKYNRMFARKSTETNNSFYLLLLLLSNPLLLRSQNPLTLLAKQFPLYL